MAIGCVRYGRVSRKKKIPETDAIFDELIRTHAAAADDETVLRLSLDAKATVAIGAFSRRGRSRVAVHALDHDFKPEAKLTPFGIFLPEHDELCLYFTASRVTSDFIADRYVSITMRHFVCEFSVEGQALRPDLASG